MTLSTAAHHLSESDNSPTADLRVVVLFGNTTLLGNERANIETLRQLKDRGAQIIFLVRREWAKPIHDELDRLGLPFRYCLYYDTLRYGVGWRVWFKNVTAITAASLYLLALAIVWRPTHIHLGSTAWAANFIPALVVLKTPLVFRAGDVPPRHHALWRWVWSYIRRRAAVFVCDSHFVETRLVAMGAPTDRCQVVYAPAPDRAAGCDPALAPFRRTADELTIVYIGQISAAKGVDLLVDAVESLIGLDRKIRLFVAGDYSWRNPFGQQLVKRVQVAGLSDKIVFTGFVNDISALYRLSDLHVAPSVWEEPYGLTVLEAKAFGLPSIVFPSGGLTELVVHGVEGWVCSQPSASSLIEALEAYLADPARLAANGLAAQRSLTSRLGVQEFGQKWRSIYESVNHG